MAEFLSTNTDPDFPLKVSCGIKFESFESSGIVVIFIIIDSNTRVVKSEMFVLVNRRKIDVKMWLLINILLVVFLFA